MFHSPGEVKCELLQDSASDIAGQVEIAKLSEVLHPVAGACFVDWTPGQAEPRNQVAHQNFNSLHLLTSLMSQSSLARCTKASAYLFLRASNIPCWLFRSSW